MSTISIAVILVLSIECVYGRPGQRFGHSITSDNDGNLILFGGYSFDSFDFTKKFQTWDYTSGLKNDVWMFNLTGGSWSVLEPNSETRPTGRAFHAASYRSGRLYVHGGNDYLLGNNERGGTSFMKLCGLDDLWSFEVSSRVWVKIHDFEGTCSGISSAHTSKEIAWWCVFMIAFITCVLTIL